MTTETSLSHLLAQIESIRRGRARRRLLGVASRLLVAFLVAACILFALDWTLSLDVFQRALVIAVLIGVVGWWTRRALRALGRPETSREIALRIEREERLDSDLVAAMQFAEEKDPMGESVSLRAAVVEGVASLGVDHDFRLDPPRDRLRTWAVLLSFLLIGVAVAIGLSPHTFRCFCHRALLGADLWPTATRIVEVRIDGRPRTYDDSGRAHESLLVAEGQPVEVLVRHAGEQPDSAILELLDELRQSKFQLSLAPSEDGFAARILQFDDVTAYRISLGDAPTRTGSVSLLKRPVVELQLAADKAERSEAGTGVGPIRGGLRAVAEGASVTVLVRSASGPLAKVEIETRTAVEGEFESPLRVTPLGAQGGDRRRWSLLPTPGSPFEDLRAAVRYRVRAVDDHGLSPRAEIEGTLDVIADKPPVVSLASIHDVVLPAARPRVLWAAADDRALQEVELAIELQRSGQVVRSERRTLEGEGGTEDSQNRRRGSLSLDLEALDPRLGDRIVLTLSAQDAGGERTEAGRRSHRTTSSEPWTFRVVDPREYLGALLETDAESVRQLEAIIERQLQVQSALESRDRSAEQGQRGDR